MRVERAFLGWAKPALVEVAERYADRYGRGGAASRTIDMSEVLVVVPGGRAGRRLIELLLESAEGRGAVLVPPRVVTAGALAERLYEPERPIASAIVRRLCWAAALRDTSIEHLASLGVDASAMSHAEWLALAELVERLHEALATELLTFAEVSARAEAAGLDFDDELRWAALASVRDGYLAKLASIEQADPQEARRRAIDGRRCAMTGELHLVGVAELNGQVRAMLGQIDAPATAWVFAPRSLADRFDALGCVVPGAWADATIDIDDAQIDIVQRPIDQAVAVVRALAGLGGRHAAEQITVGVCDAEVTPYLQQQCAACGIAARDPIGRPLKRTGPYHLLDAVASYVQHGRFADFASLVRHPDLRAYLAEALREGGAAQAIDDWITLLDRYYNDHLQARLAEPWLGDDDLRQRMAALYGAMHREEMVGGLSGRRPMSAWAPRVLALLLSVYGNEPIDRHDAEGRLVIEACDRLHAALEELAEAPGAIDEPVGAAEAIRLLLRRVEREAIPPPVGETAIELLGPLELALDDAPVLLVTGVNEGRLPASANADAFLPDGLRAALGLEDNARRYARDAYAIEAMRAGREYVRYIAGRQTAAGDPLRPSRLMLAAEPRTVAARVRRWLGDDEADAFGGRAAARLAAGVRSQFKLPPDPRPLRRPFESMRVTDFRTYLACPYRFYLSRGLRLEAVDDEAAELDGLRFGGLAHDVLEAFGRGEIAGSADAREIEAFLRDALGRIVGQRYGSDPLAAIRIQRAQLEARLDAFARWQARWRGAGWRIEMVERRFTGTDAPFMVDGKPMYLRGRIDRIDHHEATGEWAVFDYKTGDAAKSPEKTHRAARRGECVWVDLQLPLYRHLARALKDETGAPLIDAEALERMMLGYILLPRDVSEVGEAIAAWDAAALESADDAAAEVVRKVRAQRFDYDEANDPPAHHGDEFAAICGRDLLAAGEGGDGEGGNDA